MPCLRGQLLLRPHPAEVQPREAPAAGQGTPGQIGINHAPLYPSSLKVYLSVPMIANRALDRARLMAKAIADAGHEVSSPWVLGPVERTDSKAVNVFQRDREGAEESDVLVADVSEPSIGVGMEIMAAYRSGRRIILVEKKGKVVSRMLTHMDGAEQVLYDRDEDVYGALVRLLGAGSGKQKPI